MSSFGLISTQSQKLISSMSSDETFVENYILESWKRLDARQAVLTSGLMQVRVENLQSNTVGNLQSNTGLFYWMDLRRLLKEPTFEAEMELWRLIINEAKLNIHSPGSSFHFQNPVGLEFAMHIWMTRQWYCCTTDQEICTSCW